MATNPPALLNQENPYHVGVLVGNWEEERHSFGPQATRQAMLFGDGTKLATSTEHHDRYRPHTLEQIRNCRPSPSFSREAPRQLLLEQRLQADVEPKKQLLTVYELSYTSPNPLTVDESGREISTRDGTSFGKGKYAVAAGAAALSLPSINNNKPQTSPSSSVKASVTSAADSSFSSTSSVRKVPPRMLNSEEIIKAEGFNPTRREKTIYKRIENGTCRPEHLEEAKTQVFGSLRGSGGSAWVEMASSNNYVIKNTSRGEGGAKLDTIRGTGLNFSNLTSPVSTTTVNNTTNNNNNNTNTNNNTIANNTNNNTGLEGGGGNSVAGDGGELGSSSGQCRANFGDNNINNYNNQGNVSTGGGTLGGRDQGNPSVLGYNTGKSPIDGVNSTYNSTSGIRDGIGGKSKGVSLSKDLNHNAYSYYNRIDGRKADGRSNYDSAAITTATFEPSSYLSTHHSPYHHQQRLLLHAGSNSSSSSSSNNSSGGGNSNNSGNIDVNNNNSAINSTYAPSASCSSTTRHDANVKVLPIQPYVTSYCGYGDTINARNIDEFNKSYSQSLASPSGEDFNPRGLPVFVGDGIIVADNDYRNDPEFPRGNVPLLTSQHQQQMFLTTKNVTHDAAGVYMMENSEAFAKGKCSSRGDVIKILDHPMSRIGLRKP